MPTSRPNKLDILDMINERALAIMPGKLEEINAFIDARLAGIPTEFAAAAQAEQQGDDDPYTIIDGVAVISVSGVIAKRMNLMSKFSGGTSIDLLDGAITQALDDQAVDAIVLRIDSPGGTVDGTTELSNKIYINRSVKPIVAYSDGLMASAAAWIGTSASKVVSSEASVNGSIGVLIVHYDRSKQNEMMGVKKTIVSAGKYKALGNQEEPLTQDARNYLQDQVDYFYSMFVDAIARNRGTDAKTVLEKMADGKTFIGKQGLESGLIDTIGTLETAIQVARKEIRMDLDTLKKEHPALFAQVLKAGAESGKAEVQVEIDRVKAAALETEKKERDRVAGIMAIPGMSEQHKAEAISQGLTIDAAYRLAYEREMIARDEAKERRLANTPALAVKPAQSPKNSGDFMALVEQYESENKVKRGAAMMAIRASHPELHEAWLQSVQKTTFVNGRVK